MTYQTMQTLPSWTHAQWSDDGKKLLNEDAKKTTNLWSSTKFDPPAIGAKIEVFMGGFENGIVQGYFVEHGWLGMLVCFAKRPRWHVSQRGKGRHVQVHVFGVDLKAVTP